MTLDLIIKLGKVMLQNGELNLGDNIMSKILTQLPQNDAQDKLFINVFEMNQKFIENKIFEILPKLN